MIMSCRRALVVLALVPMVALGAPPASRAQTPSVSAPESVRVLEALESAFVAVADRAMPAVVNVTVKTKRGPGGADVPGGPEMEERFMEFFGQ